MSMINLIHERLDFMPLWERASEGVQRLLDVSPAELLYFDPFDIVTPRLYGLIQTLLAIKGTTAFATVILTPNPFNYFHYHFEKYPGFVHGRDNTYVEFFNLMMQDPGDSPADALGVNYDHYVIMPIEGDWIAFGDHPWDTGVFYGPPDIVECARKFYPYFGTPPSGFRVEP